MDKKIFISYCHKNAEAVRNIAEKIQKHYKIWIDINDLESGVDLKKQLADGLKSSDLFLCFISSSYCESTSCIQEFSFAESLHKSIFPVMLEKEASNGIDLSIANLNRFNAYKSPNTFEPWTQNSDALYEKLLAEIIKHFQPNKIKVNNLFIDCLRRDLRNLYSNNSYCIVPNLIYVIEFAKRLILYHVLLNNNQFFFFLKESTNSVSSKKQNFKSSDIFDGKLQ